MPPRSTPTESTLRKETGKGWDDWFQALALWGALQKGRADSIRHLRDQFRLTRRLAAAIMDRYLAMEKKASNPTRTKPAVHEVRLQKSIRTSPQEVYDAWTVGPVLAQWLTTRARVQLRVGGWYDMAGRTRGRYLELEPPKRIRMTWDHERQCPGTEVTVSIAPKGKSGSIIKLVHRPLPSHEDAIRMREVWSRALERLASRFEKGASDPTRLWVRARG